MLYECFSQAARTSQKRNVAFAVAGAAGSLCILAATAGAQAPPNRAPTTIAANGTASSRVTRYERDRSLFRDVKDVTAALAGSDMDMRRSAVECLAQWTGDSDLTPGVIYSGRAVVFSAKNQVVPLLTTVVNEVPAGDLVLTASLLASYAPHDHGAFAALCEALVSPVFGEPHGRVYDFVGRAAVLNSLTHCAGGLDALIDSLINLLHDPDAKYRAAAARAAGYCDDAEFNNISCPPAGHYPAWSTDRYAWQKHYVAQIVPELAKSLADPVPGVAIDAARSIARLSREIADGGQSVVKPLIRAEESPNIELRTAALKALAKISADASEATAQIRQATRLELPARDYALIALKHALMSDRIRGTTIFLTDLKSPSVSVRRMAASDVKACMYLLWDQGFESFDLSPKRDGWEGISALFTPVSEYDSPPSPAKKLLVTETTEDMILAALNLAARDPDSTTAIDAGLGLEKIGKLVSSHLGYGGQDPGRTRRIAIVATALTRASASLSTRAPLLSLRLKNRSAEITGPHERA